MTDSVRSILLNATGILAALLLIYLGWQQVWDSLGEDLIEIGAFEVPDEVAKGGTNGAAIAADVGARLRLLARPVSEDPRDAAKYKGDVAYSLTEAGGRFDVQVPGAGMTLRDLTRAIQAGLARRRFDVTGTVTKTAGGLSAQVRVARPGASHPGHHEVVTGASIDAVIDQVTRIVARQVNPYSLVRHDLTRERRRCVASRPCDFSRGIEEIKRLVVEAPPSTIASAYIAWSYALGFLGDHAGAEEKCRFATQVDPANATAFRNWGIALNHLGKFAEAVEKFEVALRLDPNEASALFGWGDALWKLGRHEESFVKFAEGARLSPTSEWPLVSWGSRLLAQKKFDEGLERLELAVRADPLSIEAWRLVGVAHSYRGDSARELAAWKNVAALAPENAQAHERIGSALNELERYAEAVPAFDRALALAVPQERLLSSLQLGWALYKLGHYESAIDEYRKSRSVRETADSYAIVGDALSGLGRDKEALAEYETAGKIAPNRPSIFENWADSLLKLRRFEEAVAKSTQAIDVATKRGLRSKIGHINRAHAMLALGRLPEAIADYSKAADIDPTFAAAWCGWGRALERKGESEQGALLQRWAATLAKHQLERDPAK